MAKIDRICAYCGGPFKAKPSDVARGWANCCCKTCAAKNREKRHANYLPPLYKPTKESV